MIDKLKLFFSSVKEISFFQRIFSWSKIKALSYDAFDEFKNLERNIELSYSKIDELNKKYSDLKISNKNIEDLNTEFKSELKYLREKNNDLIAENSRYKSKEDQRAEEHAKNMGQFTQAAKIKEEETAKMKQDIADKENEKLEIMKRQWQNHEKETQELIENLCSTLRIEYVKEPQLDKIPDNTIRILGEYIIFDAKSPKTDDLTNFPIYIKNQAKSLHKYTSQKGVKNDIFLVVPSNTLEYINDLKITMNGYNVFIIAKDSMELTLISLKKIEDIDLAGKLDPRDRDNLVNVIGSFAYFVRRNGRINLELGEYSVNLIEKMRSIVPKEFTEDVKNNIAGQSFNIAYDKSGKAEDTSVLKKHIQEQKNKADLIDISPLNPDVRKGLIMRSKD